MTAGLLFFVCNLFVTTVAETVASLSRRSDQRRRRRNLFPCFFFVSPSCCVRAGAAFLNSIAYGAIRRRYRHSRWVCRTRPIILLPCRAGLYVLSCAASAAAAILLRWRSPLLPSSRCLAGLLTGLGSLHLSLAHLLLLHYDRDVIDSLSLGGDSGDLI